MSAPRFSASQHHIPPVPLGHSTLINPAAAEKVMQEPHFGAFLHHFLSNPQKAARIRGARRIARARPAGFSPGGEAPSCGGSHAGFGPLSDEMKREARMGTALRASLAT